jgi:hypothetical protein
MVSDGEGQATKPNANCKTVKHLKGPHGFWISREVREACDGEEEMQVCCSVVLHLHFDWK